MAEGAGNEIALRAATPEDRALLEAIYASTRADELALTGWSDEQKAAFCAHQFLAQDTHYRQHYPTAEYLIIERGGEAAGRLYVNRGAREIRVMDIALLPAHRGAGIGTRLFRNLQAEAAPAGKALTIHVELFNPAMRLYERLGFRPIGEASVYLLMEWRAETGEPAGAVAEQQ